MFKWADTKAAEEKPNPPPLDPRTKMLKWFAFAHLQPELQKVSKEFNSFAYWMMENIPAGVEATEALRHLLMAKDCAVRAAMDRD